MEKRKFFKILLPLFLGILLAIMFELVFFQREALLHPIAPKTINFEKKDVMKESLLEPLSTEEEDSILLERKNAKLLAEIEKRKYEPQKDVTLLEKDGKMYRIKTKLTIQKDLDNTSNYIGYMEVHLKKTEKPANVSASLTKNKNVVWEEKNHAFDNRVGICVLQPKRAGNTLQLEISSVENLKPEQLQLIVGNECCISYARIFAFASIFWVLCFGCTLQKVWREHLEYAFGLMAILLGTTLLLSIGTNQISFDEHIHFGATYDLSFFSEIKTTESAMEMRADTIPAFSNEQERKFVAAYENQKNDYKRANISRRSKMITYSQRSYLPLAASMAVGRILHLPFMWNMMLAKWGSLLFYTFVVGLAIRYAKQGKVLIAAIGLIPNNIFAATSFTYDAVVHSFLILAVTLMWNEWIVGNDENKKIEPLSVLCLLGAYIAGSTAKPIYMIMALMFLFLPACRFPNKKRAFLSKLFVLVLVFVMLYVIFFPPVSASSAYELVGNIAYAGDKRNQGTSVLGQLQFILQNPFSYATILLRSMFRMLFEYLFGIKSFIGYAYLGTLPSAFTWIGLFALFGIALTSPEQEKRCSLGKGGTALTLLMIFAMSAVIWTSMYVSYTAVGNSEIEGVQARYFLPLFLPFFSCFMNNRIHLHLKQENYAKLFLGIMVFINMAATWKLALFSI